MVAAIAQLVQLAKPPAAPKRRLRDLYRPRPTFHRPIPFVATRLALLTHLACMGVTEHVAFGRA